VTRYGNIKIHAETAVRLSRTRKRAEWLIAAAKRSHAVEDLPDTIIEAVRSAKMDKRHNLLNKLMRAT
jgi:hypothetical protein